MSQEGTPWATVVIVVATALLLTAGVIGGLVMYGGQDWLLPGRTPATPAPQVADENLGLAEYVDRTLLLDGDGRMSIDGTEYDDAGLRTYLQRLREGGGVHLTLHVDSDGPSRRRVAVEKICEEVTGLQPEVLFAADIASPLPKDEQPVSTLEGDLDSDLTAP